MPFSCRYCGSTFERRVPWELHEEYCSQKPRAEVEPVGYPVIDHPQEVAATNGHLSVPIPDPHFVMPRSIVSKLGRLDVISSRHPVNVLLTGMQGGGKTSLAIQFAARYNRPLFLAPCVTMQEPREWWGDVRFRPDLGTFYEPSLFIEAVETPRCVVVLDDLNRVENPKVVNPLYKLLDDQREIYLQELGRYLKVASGVIFFATANEGWQFVGIDPIDRAFRDRFHQIQVPPIPAESLARVLSSKTGIDKMLAGSMALFASQVNDSREIEGGISTRQLILMAEDIVAGADLADAVRLTLLPGFPADDHQRVMLLAQTHLGIREASDDQWQQF